MSKEGPERPLHGQKLSSSFCCRPTLTSRLLIKTKHLVVHIAFFSTMGSSSSCWICGVQGAASPLEKNVELWKSAVKSSSEIKIQLCFATADVKVTTWRAINISRVCLRTEESLTLPLFQYRLVYTHVKRSIFDCFVSVLCLLLSINHKSGFQLSH